MRRRTKKSKRVVRRGQRKHRGGSWQSVIPAMIAEARTVQTAASNMDSYNAPFLVAGSTAVAILLHELLTADGAILTAEEQAEGEAVLTGLQKPDDLDFKFRSQGGIFSDHIRSDAAAPAAPVLAPAPGKLGLRLSISTSFTTTNDCSQYVDLAGFRCCHPLEESPIFTPYANTGTTLFSKVEFHAPREFRQRPMHAIHIQGLDVLGLREILFLYERYEVAANAPKLAAIRYLLRTVEAHPELAEKYTGKRF